DYPANLRPVGDAPPLLFVRGTLQLEDDRSVAIVGTRQPSLQGIQNAEDLGRGLAERGVTIVSGLAPGIATAAQRGALQAAEGRTLAVPGSGLRAIYPPENIPLAEKIASRGALLSEVNPNTVVNRQNLWARNRIVSGLSRAVIVVEAAERSGSLSTAEAARRQGRLVFAVPGSPGTGALVVTGAEVLDPHALDLEGLSARLPGGYLLLSPRSVEEDPQPRLAFVEGE